MRRLRRAQQRRKKEGKRFKRSAIAAGTAAAISLTASLATNNVFAKFIPSSHKIPVSQDADNDLLSDLEEIAIGYKVFNADQNRNLMLDGEELAMRCAAVIDQLPWKEDVTDPNQTYKWCDFQFGLETCEVCGATVNMGPAGIVNPKLGLEVDCPLIAIHYMEHGSFSYKGDLNSGRLDVDVLLRALEVRFPYEPNEHQLPLDYVVKTIGQLAPDANDLDGDLLADSEELDLGYNLYNADQNNNITPDGIELAKQCADVIDALPLHNPYNGNPAPEQIYKIEHMARGNETCDICAEIFNMGYLEIINPQSQLTINIPIISVHYMSHGSLSYAGSTNAGRVDIPLLVKLLEMPHRCGDLGTIFLLGDLNEDCKLDFKDFAELADDWLQSTDPQND